MLRVTTWKPDTCKCTIEYVWDDAVSQDARVHTGKSIVSCDAHTSLLANQTADAAYNTVLLENQSKNKALHHVLENFPEVVDVVTNPDGTQSKQLKKGVQYNYSFDANRQLHVDVTGLTPDKKAALGQILKTNSIVAQVATQ